MKHTEKEIPISRPHKFIQLLKAISFNAMKSLYMQINLSKIDIHSFLY